MSFAINQISRGIFDEEVHNEFIKFSRGIFEHKYIIEAKKQKNLWSIKSNSDLANFFVKSCLEKLSSPVHIKGAVITSIDIKSHASFPISDVKQFRGIKQFFVDSVIDPEKLRSLIDRFPKAFYALSFSDSSFNLKIKPKAPKSAKPETNKNKESRANFCSLKTSDQWIIHELFFDTSDFNTAKADHTIKINEVILPFGEKDPTKIRELAKKKGVITRNININGKETIKEYPFEV